MRKKRKKRTSYGIEAVRKRLIGLSDLVLEGKLLAIDPSCISTNSNPGYAWFNKGELIETGIIEGISPTETLERRLQFIGKYCREEFDEPDVLAIEHIQMGGRINMQSTIRATGTFIGSFECEIIPISPLAWQAFIEKRIPLGEGSEFIKYKVYKELHKSDEKDAEMIGRAIIEIAKEL
jgi:hypothetical protein